VTPAGSGDATIPPSSGRLECSAPRVAIQGAVHIVVRTGSSRACRVRAGQRQRTPRETGAEPRTDLPDVNALAALRTALRACARQRCSRAQSQVAPVVEDWLQVPGWIKRRRVQGRNLVQSSWLVCGPRTTPPPALRIARALRCTPGAGGSPRPCLWLSAAPAPGVADEAEDDLQADQIEVRIVA
jgi:hypothetical protein